MAPDASGSLWQAVVAIAGPHGLGFTDLLGLAAHFGLLSLLAVGGAITTAPEMQRHLVGQQGWLTDAQFTASVAVAQAAPGPNILFVALLGWNTAGLPGLVACMGGILLPSSLLAIQFARYGQRHAEALWMRAFTAGLTPLTLGLLLSTGWVLLAPAGGVAAAPGSWAGSWAATGVLVALTVWASLRTRINPVWLIVLGGVLGACGWL